MQSAQLPTGLQIHRQFFGSGKELQACANNSVRIMRRSAIRAGAATVECDHVDKERKHRHVRGTSTSHRRHSILKTSKVGLKKMTEDYDMLLSHYEFLHLASRVREEVESGLLVQKSKKPHRLSTNSWEILD